MKSETTHKDTLKDPVKGIRSVPDGESRTTDNTGIWDLGLDRYVSISSLIDIINTYQCFHDDNDKPCEKTATCFCVYTYDFFPACASHAMLKIEKYHKTVTATIDKDGLHVLEGENIDEVLSTWCDRCHSFEHMTEIPPNLSNEGKPICEDCFGK